MGILDLDTDEGMMQFGLLSNLFSGMANPNQQTNPMQQMLAMQNMLKQRKQEKQREDFMKRLPELYGQAPGKSEFKPDTFPGEQNPFGEMYGGPVDMDMAGNKISRHGQQAPKGGVMEQVNQGTGLLGGKLTQQDLAREFLGSGIPEFQKVGVEQLFPKQEDYTLSPGSMRFRGEKMIAQAPELPNPNKPFNPDGTPNLAYQKYEMEKAARGAARQTQIVNPAKDPFKNEKALRDEYTSNPVVKSAGEMQGAFNIIKQAYNNPSAANDLAMATKFMKILDPTSVVRESEFAMAVNATGLLDKVYNYAEMIKTGKRLNPAQRKDFYDSAERINAAFQEQRSSIGNEYESIANEYGLNPENVTLKKLRGKSQNPIQVPALTGGKGASAFPGLSPAGAAALEKYRSR